MINAQEKIEEVKNILVSEVNPEAIILFGSRARKDHDNNSDFDFLIVLDDGAEISRKTPADIYFKISKPRIPCDFIFQTKSEFEFWKKSPNHIVGHACREGKRIYERKN